MKYKDRYEDEDQHEQSVHSKTWQDMGKVTEFPEVDPAENDTIQKKEKIPQISAEEQQAVEDWRNSPAMQKGLLNMLPKSNGSNAASNESAHENLPQIIQKQEIEGEEESTNTTASRIPAVAVPNIIDVTSINDPVARNNQINSWYNMVDSSMTTYLGTPQVPNWATYGKHASSNAGAQIRNMDDGIATLGDVASILGGLIVSDPIGSIQSSIRAFRTVTGLLSQEGMTQQAMQLGFAKAGVSDSNIQDVIDASAEVTTFEWSDLIPGVALYEQAELAGSVGKIALKVASAIPTIISSLASIRNNLITGNTQIYQNIAPVYASFFAAANASATGNPGEMSFAGDSNGFISAGFALYGEVAALARQIAVLPDGPEKEALKAERLEKIKRANLLVVFHEQAIVAQPIYDLMFEELAAMSGTMSIVDPNGTFELLPNGGNWADLYTRMGMDPTGAPAIEDMTADEVPEFRDENDPAAEGTIGAYFGNVYNEDGEVDTSEEDDPETEEKLHEDPAYIERLRR